MSTGPARYCIRIKGQVGPEWSEWFGGMTITCDEQNETTLCGQVLDQAALYGILNKIQALGLTLLSVQREAPAPPIQQATTSHKEPKLFSHEGGKNWHTEKEIIMITSTPNATSTRKRRLPLSILVTIAL